VANNVALLKKYRNGVYHYQKNYFDNRFMDFMSQGQNIVTWVRDLNRAFGGYFLMRRPRPASGGGHRKAIP
jgi:hypothetical protein